MPLVDSLLTAVVRSDGDALVLHVGEKPYVVAATGPVELSRQGLGLGAMEGMLAQLLSADALRSLREMGAVEHELDDRPAANGDRFTVVAARGGDDIWIELRRHRRVASARAVVVPTPAPEPVAPVVVETPAPAATRSAEPEPAPAAVPAPAAARIEEPPVAVPIVVPASEPEPDVAPAPVVFAAPIAIEPAPADVFEPAPDESPIVIEMPDEFEMPAFASVVDEPDPFDMPVIEIPVDLAHLDAEQLAVFGDPGAAALAELEAMPEFLPADGALEPVEIEAPAAPPAFAAVPEPVATPEPAPPALEPATVAPAVPAAAQTPEPVPVAAASAAEPVAVAPPAPVAVPSPPAPAVAAAPAPRPAPVVDLPPAPRPEPVSVPSAWTSPAVVPPRFDATEPGYSAAPEHPMLPGLASELEAMGRAAAPTLDPPDQSPAVVLSLTRDNARGGGSGTRGGVRPGGIERLLRLAAARGASALYLTTQARPAIRVDGDIRLLDGESALSSGDVEAAVLELAPEGARDKESAEWIRDLADVGRVRITTFRDYRGPGALLRMIQARATSAEQLGLVREIQALATEPEGLVIVTGPRASGKSTLMSAFVDLLNRQRNDYVITLEGQIRLVHESRGSLISQRELRGSAAEVVAAARAALRENPDVLVIEDLRSPDVLQVALDAAGSGLLVFASVTAASATASLERLVDLCPSEQRRTVRAALAEHLRGVVAQVLLRKAGGGRLAARELVLNTNAVAALVSDGQIAQLPRAIDSGRKLGMAPLNDALVAFVQSGAVDVREAYRKADDKAGLLALLRREGIDTSFVERLA